MPQFDFGNVFIPQLFWLAVFFVILYFGIVRLTLPKLGQVIDQRESKIAADLSGAQTAKEQADGLTDANQALIAERRETARASMANAQAAAAAARAEKIAAADAASHRQIADAEARISAARSAAEVSLADAAVESTKAIVARLTGSEPTDADARAAVAAASSPA